MTDLGVTTDLTAAELTARFKESTTPTSCSIFGLCPNPATELVFTKHLGVIAGCHRCIVELGLVAA